MTTTTRENKFYHQKFIFKGLLKENVPENIEIQIRTTNQSLRTQKNVILEYKNFQKQQSFYINYANMLYRTSERNKKM